MKAHSIFLCLALLASAAAAEDYQCRWAHGCSAEITQNGETSEVIFNKGDIVNTDAGWVVSSSDGWAKIRHDGSLSEVLDEPDPTMVICVAEVNLYGVTSIVCFTYTWHYDVTDPALIGVDLWQTTSRD